MKKLLFLIFSLIYSLNLFVPESRADKIKVALLGDSMTWIGGENFDNPNGWTYYLSDLPLDIRLYARSGATWCNTSETKSDPRFYSEVIHPDNVIYNQVLRLANDGENFHPDIILIYAGANDAWFADKRPDLFKPFDYEKFINSTPTPGEHTDLISSIYISSILLKAQFPDTEIFFITPAYAGKIPSEKIEKVGDIIEESGQKLSIPVLRGDRIFPIREADEQPGDYHLTYDGAHSNPEGAKAIADCICQHIILPYLQRF